MPGLSEVFQHPAVREIGDALGKALGDEETQDYASLMDLEFAQTPVDFADGLHRFMRRFLTFVGKKGWYAPSAERLSEVMQLMDELATTMPFADEQRKALEALRLVRAAILSRALAEACRIKRQTQKEQQSQEQGGDQ